MFIDFDLELDFDLEKPQQRQTSFVCAFFMRNPLGGVGALSPYQVSRSDQDAVFSARFSCLAGVSASRL